MDKYTVSLMRLMVSIQQTREALEKVQALDESALPQDDLDFVADFCFVKEQLQHLESALDSAEGLIEWNGPLAVARLVTH